MPHIYRAEQTIPEVGGPIRGGVSVVVHSPQEVQGLIALVALAGRPPEDPMQAIHDELATGRFDPDRWISWQQRVNVPRQRDETQSMSGDVTREPQVWEDLDSALRLALDLWNRSKEAPSNGLCLVMTVADPRSGETPTLEIEANRPGLIIDRGSLRVRLIWGGLKFLYSTGAINGVQFVVGLFLGFGIAPSQCAEDLLNELRVSAAQRQPAPYLLPRLDEAKPGAYRDFCGVIVFLHGLLSTDLGLFDEVIYKTALSQKTQNLRRLGKAS